MGERGDLRCFPVFLTFLILLVIVIMALWEAGQACGICCSHPVVILLTPPQYHRHCHRHCHRHRHRHRCYQHHCCGQPGVHLPGHEDGHIWNLLIRRKAGRGLPMWGAPGNDYRVVRKIHSKSWVLKKYFRCSVQPWSRGSQFQSWVLPLAPLSSLRRWRPGGLIGIPRWLILMFISNVNL